jgi:hypothetical protein
MPKRIPEHMPKTITIDEARTILQIIGEEDSIGLDKDEDVQAALALIDDKIEALNLPPDHIILSY